MKILITTSPCGTYYRNTARENSQRVDYDYEVGDKVLIAKDGILRKAESKFHKDPWTITTVHTNMCFGYMGFT